MKYAGITCRGRQYLTVEEAVYVIQNNSTPPALPRLNPQKSNSLYQRVSLATENKLSERFQIYAVQRTWHHLGKSKILADLDCCCQCLTLSVIS